jgi:hypothetical protein
MDQQNTLTQQVLSMLDKGSTRQDVIDSLQQAGHDESFVKEFVGEAIKNYTLKRRAQGFALILGGAIICLLSCVATLVAGGGTALPYMLYGATSLGIIVVFAGLMRIF